MVEVYYNGTSWAVGRWAEEYPFTGPHVQTGLIKGHTMTPNFPDLSHLIVPRPSFLFKFFNVRVGSVATQSTVAANLRAEEKRTATTVHLSYSV